MSMTGQIHDAWFCCRPYLLELLSFQKEIPIAPSTLQFLTAGTSSHIMQPLPGHPTLHPPPPIIIQVQRDYWSKNLLSLTTLYFFFAKDEGSKLWYEIGDEAWEQVKRGMTLHSHVKTFCKECRVAHSFLTYKTHTAMLEEFPGFFGCRRQVDEDGPASRKEMRKVKAKA